MLKRPHSYSKLSTYEKCPAQAKYRYVDRLRPERSDSAQRGVNVHQSIEDYLGRKTKDVHIIMTPYLPLLQGIRRNKPDTEEKLAIDDRWRPVPWEQRYDKAWITAVLDSSFMKKNAVEIQEWKTGKVYSDHEDQRHLYILIAAVKYPLAHRYNATSYYFDIGDKHELELEQADLPEVRNNFTNRLTIMENDTILAPRPGYYCSWCPFAKSKGGPCKFGP